MKLNIIDMFSKEIETRYTHHDYEHSVFDYKVEVKATFVGVEPTNAATNNYIYEIELYQSDTNEKFIVIVNKIIDEYDLKEIAERWINS